MDWIEYFMSMVELISTRSKDPNTKMGCVLTDSSNRIISTGYNGPIQGVNDSQIPLTRPDKYFYMIHAEENAMYFRDRSLFGGNAYITAPPCARCARGLMQQGIKNIYFGPKRFQNWEEEFKHVQHMANLKQVNLINVADLKK